MPKQKFCRNTLASEDKLISLGEDRNDSLINALIGIIQRLDRVVTAREAKVADLDASNAEYKTRFRAIQNALNSREFGGG